MADAPKFSTPPTPQEIDRIIAQAHEMRAEYTAEMLRKLVAGLKSLFQGPRHPSDLTT
ncbi:MULTISPECIES: RSP_7527 family protein [unclassified Roseovarius]|uniref:RSP_7527 family protein n=1 Tax=unclassified Roseovarius TaxID=2614913 RepID=UPI00273DEC35|nr:MULTISPECIES: hypothetical protein [unclassified Roseovarius]